MKEEDRGRGDGTEEGKEERKEIFSQDPLGADDPIVHRAFFQCRYTVRRFRAFG